jgi:hypothetical protein
VIFYVTAAILYPNYFNPRELFFCDLMDIHVGREKHFNAGLPFALMALLSISIVVAGFFIWFANQSKWSNKKKLFTKITGSLSAFFIVFVWTELHDEILIISSIIGSLPLALIALEIIKERSNYSLVFGLITLSILVLYNLTFYLNLFEFFWPIMQKTCIILSLIWINIMAFNTREQGLRI